MRNVWGVLWCVLNVIELLQCHPSVCKEERFATVGNAIESVKAELKRRKYDGCRRGVKA